MTSILVVGNIIKDVYLNLDARTEHFEVDGAGTKWLNIAFDATDHHFFRRSSSFGGAVVSLEVLRKMGLDAKINGSEIGFDDDGVVAPEIPEVYRYILVADDTQISYLTPNAPCVTRFVEPSKPVDFIYIDRSVELSENVAEQIVCYLEQNPNVKLVLYFKPTEDFHERKLLGRATLVFSETDLAQVPDEKLVLITSDKLKYLKAVEPISLARPDLSTHLSLFSTAAATILGAFALGRGIEEGLRLARANIENSRLDTTLDLRQMERLAETPAEDPFSLALVAQSLQLPNKKILDAADAEPARKEYFAQAGITDNYSARQDYYCDLLKKTDLTRQFTGVTLTSEMLGQFTDDGRSFVDFLTDQRIVPGAAFVAPSRAREADCKVFAAKFKEYREMGVRFLKWNLPQDFPEVEALKIAANLARCAVKTGLVPVFDTTNRPEFAKKIAHELEQSGIDILTSVIL